MASTFGLKTWPIASASIRSSRWLKCSPTSDAATTAEYTDNVNLLPEGFADYVLEPIGQAFDEELAQAKRLSERDVDALLDRDRWPQVTSAQSSTKSRHPTHAWPAIANVPVNVLTVPAE